MPLSTVALPGERNNFAVKALHEVFRQWDRWLHSPVDLRVACRDVVRVDVDVFSLQEFKRGQVILKEYEEEEEEQNRIYGETYAMPDTILVLVARGVVRQYVSTVHLSQGIFCPRQ